MGQLQLVLTPGGQEARARAWGLSASSEEAAHTYAPGGAPPPHAHPRKQFTDLHLQRHLEKGDNQLLPGKPASNQYRQGADSPPQEIISLPVYLTTWPRAQSPARLPPSFPEVPQILGESFSTTTLQDLEDINPDALPHRVSLLGVVNPGDTASYGCQPENEVLCTRDPNVTQA